LKKKGDRKEDTLDLDDLVKIKGLGENRGGARRLLKRKQVIAL
jgi:hypothetical protein